MTVKFKPMLAASASNGEIEKFTFPLMVSPKLDGIRAIVMGGVVMSRSMKPIRNREVQALFGRPEFEGFDGELILGSPTDPDCFNHSTALMGEELREDVKHLEIQYFVFDLTPSIIDDEAVARHDKLLELKPSLPANIQIVPQVLVTSLDQLYTFEKECLDEGYEGVMVKSLDGKYKQGRSTLKQRLLTKVKRFQDSEAVVIGYEEKMTNIGEREITELGYSKTSSKKADFIPAGTLGALKVRDLETGIEFSIGSGYDDKTRDALWEIKEELMGKIVKYKHFSVGVKEAPRFPTFLGFRDADDM